MKADYHVHTSFSTDSEEEMENYLKKAIECGVNEICFTDHVDYDVANKFSGSQTVDYKKYFKKIEKLKEKYKDKVSIKAGMEFGIQRHNIEKYEKDFQAYPFDFILLSSHEIDNQEFWLYEYQEGKTQLEYNIGYYKNLLEIVKNYNNYSVLGHLDVIKRYDKAGILDDEKVLPYIEEIFKVIIANGKGIEINTSSFKYKLPDLTPSKDILRLYKKLGGEIITLGSDSHSIDRLTDSFEIVKEELKKLGFTKLCTFEKMKPKFYEI